MNIFLKIWTWIKANLASVLDAVQAIIKAIKTVITAIVNLLSIIMPASAAEALVLKIRAILEAIDGWIEKIKAYLIPAV